MFIIGDFIMDNKCTIRLVVDISIVNNESKETIIESIKGLIMISTTLLYKDEVEYIDEQQRRLYKENNLIYTSVSVTTKTQQDNGIVVCVLCQDDPDDDSDVDITKQSLYAILHKYDNVFEMPLSGFANISPLFLDKKLIYTCIDNDSNLSDIIDSKLRNKMFLKVVQ